MTAFRTLDHVEVKGKRILVRVDLNVPEENGVVTDSTRIERAAPAITEIADKGGKVILLSHFGRTKALEHPERPLAAIVGGAKISTKLDLLGNLLDKVNALVIGGAMANTFLLAQGKKIGKSLAEADLVATAREIVDKAKAEKREI